MKVYLARHAECAKNLIGIPGGKGNSLTPMGIEQAQELGERLVKLGEWPSGIEVCPPVQAQETAAIIGKRLGLPTHTREELRSINLGVLSGVPIEEARHMHPASSASMDLWRAGQIELCDVVIERMEDPRQFYYRGLRYILGLVEATEPKLIVATTSIMILFDNLNRMRGAARGEGYRVHNYANADLLTLNFLTEHKNWLRGQARIYGLRE